MIRTLPAVGASPSAFGEHGSSWRQGMPLFNSVLARRTFGYLLAGTLALLAIIVASIWLAARTVNHADEIAHVRAVRTLASTVLSELVGVGTLFAFILVCIAVIYLRETDPHVPRPFRVPQMPWLPLAGIMACLALMAGLAPMTWLRLLVWLVIGQIVYFTYGRFHSRLTGRR
jgi:amino acid transporter